MKNLIKVSACLILLFGGTQTNAQEVNIGAKAGFNLSNHGGDVDDMDAKAGFHLGLTLDYEMVDKLYLLTGFELTTKGARKKIAGTKTRTNPMYLQFPIHAGYKLPVTPTSGFVFSAGPYMAFGVGGKNKVKAKSTVVKTDFFGSEEDGGLKRFDFGLGLALGYEFNRYKISMGYDFGLVNISRSSSHKMKNENAYLTFGYLF